MPEGVEAGHTIDVVWEGGRRYRGTRSDGAPGLVVDGNSEVAPSPVDALVIALASCSAIDVEDYLQKRRTPASSLAVSVRFWRAPSPPKRLTKAHLTYRVAADSPREQVDRAVQLSFDKYCSVAGSLQPDTELTFSVELEPAAAAAAAAE